MSIKFRINLFVALISILAPAVWGNDAPTIGTIGDQDVYVDEPTHAIPLPINDTETPRLDLVVTAVSSNPTLVPQENIFFGIFAPNRYITVTPAFGLTGSATITVTVSDGTNSANTSFLFSVHHPPAGAVRFANTTAITLPDFGQASTYPSVLNVSGMAGGITDMTMTLSKLTHEYVTDLHMLLVSPSGQAVVVFASVAAGYAVDKVTVRLTDHSNYPLPQAFALWPEPLRPTDWIGTHAFPAPAPAGPYAPVAFSSFNGLPANGPWSLYIYDELAPDHGMILGGWSLMITTTGDAESPPTISDIPDQTTVVNTATAVIPFSVNDVDTGPDDLIVTAGSSNPALVPDDNVAFGGTGANRTLIVTPLPNQLGTATITVTVSDGVNAVEGDFLVTVNPAALSVSIDDAARIYGQANPAFSGAITGLQNGDNITASYSTVASAGSAVGTYAITASLNDPGGKLGNYTVTVDNGTLTIDPAALSITAADKTRNYGSANPTFTGTITGLQNGDNITGSYSTAATIGSPVGTYAIVPALNDPTGKAGNYTVTPHNGVLSITPATLTGTADNKSRVYGAANPAFTVTYSGFLNGDTASLVTGTLNGFTSAQASSPVGSYLISVSGQSAPNYNILYVNGSLTVTKADLTVTAADKSRTYGANNPTLTGSVVGLQNGDNITASYSTTANSSSSVGTYAIVPALNDPDGKAGNYTVNMHNGTLTVSPATLTGRADNKSRSYGAANPAFTATYSGFLNGDTAGIISGTLNGSSPAQATSPVGTYSISVSGQSAPNYNITYLDGTLTVSAAELVVTADSKNRTYGAANPTLTGTITGVQNGDNITATYHTTATPVSAVGSYAITATLNDPSGKLGNYTVTTHNGTLLIERALLTISAADKSRTYGVVNPPFTGSITGVQNGDNLSLTFSTTAGISSPVGTYAIKPAVNDPDGKLGNYTVSSHNGVLTVNPAVLTGTADDKSRVYGTANPSFTVTYSGFVNGEGAGIVTGTLNGSSPAAPDSPIGDYPITVSGQSAPNYSIVYVDGTLTVTAHELTVTIDNKSRTYGAANPTLTGTITGLQNGDAITATYGTTATPGSAIGSFPITASLNDPGSKLGNYTVTTHNGTLLIGRAALAISAADKSRKYGEGNPSFTGALDGVQNSDNLSLSFGTSATAASPVGPYAIVPTLNDPDGKAGNYTVTTHNGVLTVNPAVLTGTADDKSRVYGTANPSFTVTYSGFVNGEGAGIVTGTLNGSSPAAPDSPIGDYPITVSGQSAPNYSIVYVDGTLTVTAHELTVTIDNKSRTYGAANPTLTGTITGLQNGDAITATYGTTATPGSAIGSFPITASLNDPGSKLGNYTVTTHNGTLLIGRAALAISAADKSRKYGEGNPSFTGALDGVQNSDNLSLSFGTSATAASPVGPYAIVPTLNDPDGKAGNYTVTTHNGVLTVNPAVLTGTADDKSRVYGTANPSFTVTYSGFVNGEGAGIVTGTLNGASPAAPDSPIGDYPISVSGQSAPNYSIVYVDGTLTVTAHELTVTIDNKSRTYGAANPTLTGTITGLQNGDAITATYGTTATPGSAIGSFPITASLNDPGSKLGNYTVTTHNGTLLIGRAALAISAADKSRKYGEGNPSFTGALDGVQNSDNLSLSFGTSATAASPVGPYAIVPTLNDPDGKAGNYTVTTHNGVLTVNPAVLTGTADDKSRVYGTANPSFTVTYSGFVNGEGAGIVTGTLNGASPAAPDSPIGDYPISVSGQSAPNYNIVYVDGTLTVTAHELTVTIDDKSRTYGAANPTLTGTITGLQNGDVITATYSTTATPGSAIGSYPITASLNDPGSKLGNYTITTHNGTLLIGRAALAISAADKSRKYGEGNPSFTGALDGVQNSDNLSLSFGTSATAASPVGPYAIVPTLNDPDGKAGNYTVTTHNGVLTVNAAVLTGTADDKSRVYGAANPSFTGTLTGLQNGDSITATYSTTATALSPAGNYPIAVNLNDPDGKLGNYTVTLNQGTLTINSPGAVTITSVSRLENGHLRLVGLGDAGVTYTIQASSDHVNWQNIGTALAAANGVFEFEDTDANSFAFRFYRAVLP